MKIFVFVFFLTCGISYSQNLEEAIYTATETFIGNPNEASLNLLIRQESSFKTEAKTKDEQLALVFLLCHKAYYLNEHSLLKNAITSYEDALKRFNNNELSKISDFDIIESCLKPLGNLYTKTGDFTNAVSTINQYIFLAEKTKNIKHQISGAINLAKLYQTIGKHETTLKIINDALKLSDGNQKVLLQNIKIASLIALNKYEAASTLKNPTSNFEKFRNNFIIEFQKGHYDNALTSYNKAEELIRDTYLSSRDLAKFYVDGAKIHHVLNNTNETQNYLQRAIKILVPNFTADGLPSKKDLYAENTFIDIFDLYASIQPSTETALKSYNLSFHVSELLQQGWTSQESKILNQANNRNRSENCIELLLNSFNQTKNKALLFEAFQYSENNKVSVLKSIHHKKKRLKQFPKDSLLIKELQLIKSQELYTNLLIKENLRSNRASQVHALSEKLSKISLELKSLKPKLEQKYPENKDVYTLETIQQKLAIDQAILVAYFYGKNNLYQFIISEKNINVNRIELTNTTKQNIVQYIHLFDEASIINNNIKNYTNQAFSIFNLLKLNTISSYKNLVIIPDGLLNFIPFETLLSSKTSTTSFEKMPFIIKSQTITYNSSAYFYLTERLPNENNKLIGFFPVFENSNQKLTYSIDEAHGIEEEMPSKIFMNEEASKANFIKYASNYGILHLSTHASGGDFINPANLFFYDDNMYLNELYSLDFNPNLVVLSACETGIGKLYKGEGAMSLARGFQYAGAENLLFSLWQINDLSTSKIMNAFYANYGSSQSAFLANHQSKIDYLANETISNAKKSPYYWGAFVYYGKLESTKPNYTLFYVIFGISIALVVLFLFLKHKTHDRNARRISS